MEKGELRKIKEVDGKKVIHPYQFGNILYSIFILLFAALPIGILFVPLMIFPGTEITLNGLELFRFYAVEFWKEPAVDIPQGIQSVINLAKDETFATIYQYMMLSEAAVVAVMFIIGIISLIVFIVSLAKGYLKHPGGIKALAVLEFVLALLFSISFFFYYIMAMIDGRTSEFIMWFAFIPAGATLIMLIIIGVTCATVYSGAIYESEIVFHEDEKEQVVTSHVVEVHEVTKVNHEPMTTIPNDLKSIGGHEFSGNQNIQIANIPLGITVIGPSAFANCLNLRVVSIPDCVKEIGYNCFFNCVSLERLNYAGTKEQWRHIKRGSNWLAKAKTTEVVCVDGPIIVNPYSN